MTRLTTVNSGQRGKGDDGRELPGGSSQAPEPPSPAGDDETLTGELGSEGGSQGELAQAARAADEERPLLPQLVALALVLLLGAVLLWLVVTMR
ncbi:MAG: hypothetical protein ACRD2X_03760 [Vicinamibacteraceae bacterium]